MVLLSLCHHGKFIFSGSQKIDFFYHGNFIFSTMANLFLVRWQIYIWTMANNILNTFFYHATFTFGWWQFFLQCQIYFCNMTFFTCWTLVNNFCNMVNSFWNMTSLFYKPKFPFCAHFVERTTVICHNFIYIFEHTMGIYVS